jgi:DNA invertase Pin-like site-specific DNA recombinase
MRVAGYIRVSSDSQTDGTSLNSQRDQIQAYCALKKLELTTIYSDPGVSGGKPMEDRPEGSILISEIREKNLGGLVIVKLDRAFRNTIDCLTTVQEFDKLGVALHIIDLGGNSIDSTSPAGRFMLTVLSGAAEMERGMIRDRCNMGRKIRKQNNQRIGEIPYGYILGDDGKALVPLNEEQDGLLMIHKLRKEDHSLREIAKNLNTKGYKAKKGGNWTYGQVQSVLRRTDV